MNKQTKVTPSIMSDLASAKYMQDQAVSLQETSKEIAQSVIASLRDAKVSIGSLKTCAFAQAFRDAMCEKVSPKSGKAYSAGAISNMLSAIREAVKTGKAIDWNKSRTNAKTTPKADAVQGTNTVGNVAPEDTKPSAVTTTTEDIKTNREKIAIMLASIESLITGDESEDEYDRVVLLRSIRTAMKIVA